MDAPSGQRAFPNILLIMADQMRADCLQAVNPAIKTPNLQRLVDGGTMYLRAYAPTPVCLPCRCSVLTGQYPSTHGATHNESFLPQDYLPNVARSFTAAGYYTHMIGKSHFNAMHDQNSPEGAPHIFNLDFFKEWHGPWMGFSKADIAIGHTTESVACGMHYGAWLRERGVDMDEYFGKTAYTDHGTWTLPEEYHSDAWIAETTVSAIEKCKENGQPFFMWVNFQDPHNPCMVPEPWASMYDPSSLPRFGFKEGEPGSFELKPPFYKDIIEKKGSYAWRSGKDEDLIGPGNVSSLPWDQDEVQRNAAAYYGMVSMMDKYIGKILDALDGAGLASDTIVVFTSDHGDFLGDHGMFWKSLVAFEEAMHVPLVVRYPGRVPAGARGDSLHSLVDLAPTFLELAGLAVPYNMQGVSQRDTWLDPSIATRSDVVVEERPYNTAFNVRHLVTEKYKLAFYAGKDYGELYDLENDPDHRANLWDDEGHQGPRQELINRLCSWMMNKSPPRPGPSRHALDGIPEWAKDFPRRIVVAGEIRVDDAGASWIKVAFPAWSRDFIEIPVSELLEDLIGERVSISVATPTGSIKEIHGKLALDDDGRVCVHESGEAVLLSDSLRPLSKCGESLVTAVKAWTHGAKESSIDFAITFTLTRPKRPVSEDDDY